MFGLVQPAVLAHGSGLDELAIFLFPVLIGFGFWLMTRQRGPTDDEEEIEEEPTIVAPGATTPPEPRLNGHVSPFHGLITPPRSTAGDSGTEGDHSTVAS